MGTKIMVLTSAIFIFIVVLNLVRQRRLREEYSWLWLAAAAFYLVMSVWPDLIVNISSYIGITNTITSFIFFSLLFIIMILINYSVKLSTLTTKMKDIAQMIALLEADQNKLNDSQVLNESKDNQIISENISPEYREATWKGTTQDQPTGE